MPKAEKDLSAEYEKREDFVAEMVTGESLAADKNYTLDIELYKDQFSGMKVLFLVPGFDIDVRYGSKLSIERGHIQPLGAGLLATILKISGCEVKLLDIPVEKMTDEDVLDYIQEFKPKFIAISCWSPTAAKAFSLTDSIKANIPDIPIVLGGPHPTSFPEVTLRKIKSVDIVVAGEGEKTILELADYFYSGKKALSEIKGIGYRQNGKDNFTEDRTRLNNLDDIPKVDRSFFKKDGYIPLPQRYNRLPAFNLVISRGCPYACTFCFEAGRFGLKYRSQSVQRVIDEIKYLQTEFGAKEINFWDDIFLVNKKWVYEFCDALERENIDITWTCESRVDHVNPELLKRINQMGCYSIFYGFEAGTDKLLKSMKKGTTVAQNRQAAEWSADAGIAIRASFILGLPDETPEDGQKTIDFALSLPNVDALTFSFATPHPGTELFESVKHDILMDEDQYIHELTKYTQWELTYVAPAYRGREHLLHEMKKKAYKKFYFNPKYILRKIASIRNFSDIGRYYQGLKLAIGVSF